MNKYKLCAKYDIEEISYQRLNDLIIVDVPMLESNKLKYGLNHIKNILFKSDIFPTELAFDMITLSTMVYMADTRISRIEHGQDSWTREISIELPVNNKILWNNQIPLIERMLRFLTGDIWNVSFVDRTYRFELKDKDTPKTSIYDKVSLFSGGMDSLISTINLMEEKKNTLLISHAGDGYTKNAQTNILKSFDEIYPEILHNRMDLWMSFPDCYIPEGKNDSNTRSRSFLFIGFGIFVLSGLNGVNELLVPENGLIALNVPLDITRVGSFSTRTTHPFYLNLWNELLNNLGLNIKVTNPYWNKTKGEMAYECLNRDMLYETMKVSSSCSSPGKARWKGLSQQHCGYCVPCIIRKAAMYKAFGSDSTVYTINSVKEMQDNNENSIGVQLRSFQYAINKIKSNPKLAELYIHKTGPLKGNESYLKELAEIYKRGLLEVSAFIDNNLNEEERI